MGVKVTFISDTHCRHGCLKLEGGDILVFSGDLMSTGYYEYEVDDFLDWFGRQSYEYKILVPGNHDRYCENMVDEIRGKCELYYDKGVRYLCDGLTCVCGLKIYGTPYQPFFYNWAFNVSDYEELVSIYKKIPEGVDILVTHCPPFGILDSSHMPRPYFGTTGDEHLGSVELYGVLDKMDTPPRYCCFGHIHGDGGKVVEIDGRTYINASVCDEAYRPVNRIINMEIEGGDV